MEMSVNQFNCSAPAANNQKEDAPHLYISWSLHRRRPQSGRFAAFIADVGDDFFLVDVSRQSIT